MTEIDNIHEAQKPLPQTSVFVIVYVVDAHFLFMNDNEITQVDWRPLLR